MEEGRPTIANESNTFFIVSSTYDQLDRHVDVGPVHALCTHDDAAVAFLVVNRMK